MSFNRWGLAVVLGLATLSGASPVAAQASAPYPPSTVITGVSFDWSTHVRRASGSDNWPVTWSDDGHQYTAWGDGGGFGGTNTDGRVSLGFARVEGPHNNYQGFNVWGGKNPENPAQFTGKSYGILSVAGVLYAWWGDGSDNDFTAQTRLIHSTDHAQTWSQASWNFTRSDNLYAGTFLNFGQDYAGARDNYVYSYFPRGSSWAIQKPGRVDLARVPKGQILDRSAYQFFAGLDQQGNPTWTSNLSARQPVFQDPNGLETVSVGYDPGLDRYLLTIDHSVKRSGNLAIFDAPEPWGPWTTVAYFTGWNNRSGTISYYFAPKWFSADGKDFTLVFTDSDAWATVRGRFSTATADTTPPTSPSGLTANPVSQSRIDLGWNAASDPQSGVVSYDVYRNDVKVGTVSGTAFSDTGLAASTSYTYRVSAVNGAGLEGSRSGSVTAATLAAPTNQRPTVNAGGDQTITLPNTASLSGSASDDGLPDPPGTVTVQWNRVSGPAAMSFSNSTSLSATATFTQAGSYVLRLTASDGSLSASDNLTVTVNPAPSGGSLVISNLSAASGEAYQAANGLSSGDVAYIDRSYTYSSVPSGLQGATYIQTANGDKSATQGNFLSFQVNQAVRVYVAYDSRASSRPNWLAGWTDTGMTAGTTDVSLDLYSRDFPAGSVTLGGNMAAGASGASSNYTVMVLGGAVSPTPTPSPTSASPTPTVSPTVTPTITPTVSPTPANTATPTTSPTATPTLTPAPVVTAPTGGGGGGGGGGGFVPVPTPSRVPTLVAAPTPTPTAEPTSMAQPASGPALVAGPPATPTPALEVDTDVVALPEQSATLTPTPVATLTPTPTAAITATMNPESPENIQPTDEEGQGFLVGTVLVVLGLFLTGGLLGLGVLGLVFMARSGRINLPEQLAFGRWKLPGHLPGWPGRTPG